MYVWSNKGEAFKPKNTVPADKHCGGSIMLWGSGACTLDKAEEKMKEDYTENLRTVLGQCQEATSTLPVLLRRVVKYAARSMSEAC